MHTICSFSLHNDLIIGNYTLSAHYVQFSVLLGIAFVVYAAARLIVVPLLERITKKTNTRIDDSFATHKVFKRAAHLLPAIILSCGLSSVFTEHTPAFMLISKAVSLYYVLIITALINSFLDISLDIYNIRNNNNKVGLTVIIQALKVIVVIISIIVAISVLASKSPAYFITGLGAFTAILMLIFKDAILGLVAGIQLSAMDLVRKGDWIEIPKHDADGAVVDINLTTVWMRNWDMTYTTIPAYELVSSSFKNWRGMTESGGRRIKRSILFNMNCIRFLLPDDIARLRKIKILRPYIDRTLLEIEQFNSSEFSNDDMTHFVNGQRLTNIGTFRAYCLAYLSNHAGIRQDMTKMVRQLAPTELGVPLEIYAFTSDIAWVAHESVQSDIFDHLLAIVPEFNLEVYQK